jgi:hypothetical protein
MAFRNATATGTQRSQRRQRGSVAHAELGQQGRQAAFESQQLDGLQCHDADGVPDLSRLNHAKGFCERNAAYGEVLRRIGRGRPVLEAAGQEDNGFLVVHRIGQVGLEQLVPSPGAETGLLQQLTLGRLQEIDIERAAAFRDLPAVGVEREAVLAHEIRMLLGIDGHDAQRAVLVVDRAVDTGIARRCDHLVMADANPAIVVSLTRGQDAPRPALLSHDGAPAPRWCALPAVARDRVGATVRP